MINQHELEKNAKKYYLEVDTRKVPNYLFIARLHTENIIYESEKILVKNDLLDFFWFYETDLDKALSEFFTRLGNHKINPCYQYITLDYKTNSNSIAGTGIKVNL